MTQWVSERRGIRSLLWVVENFRMAISLVGDDSGWGGDPCLETVAAIEAMSLR